MKENKPLLLWPRPQSLSCMIRDLSVVLHPWSVYRVGCTREALFRELLHNETLLGDVQFPLIGEILLQ